MGVIEGLFGVLALNAVYFGIWAGLAALLGIWTDRNLDFWATFVKETPVDVPFVVAWLASIPLPLTFLANIIAEVARFFI